MKALTWAVLLRKSAAPKAHTPPLKGIWVWPQAGEITALLLFYKALYLDWLPPQRVLNKDWIWVPYSGSDPRKHQWERGKVSQGDNGTRVWQVSKHVATGCTPGPPGLSLCSSVWTFCFGFSLEWPTGSFQAKSHSSSRQDTISQYSLEKQDQ